MSEHASSEIYPSERVVVVRRPPALHDVAPGRSRNPRVPHARTRFVF